jgi:hypothetical protein
MSRKERAIEKLEYIIEMTTFEELFHDGVNIDIQVLAQNAIKILKGEM